MELFTTSVKQVIPIEWDMDVHGEGNMSGFCEACWHQDRVSNLILIHDTETYFNHFLCHESCMKKEWILCTCG